MPLVTKQTPNGQVVVGDLPDDFLCVPAAAMTAQQQMANDAATARMLQNQQMAYFGGMQMPSNTTGRLSITLSQAKLAKNYGITKMDPYCRVTIGHAVFETPTSSSGGKNPRWNKTVQCFLPKGVDSVYLEVFDEKTFQGDERVAWAHVTVPASALTGEVVNDWYPLTGKQGDGKEGMVNLVFSFSPVAPMQMMPQTQAVPQVVMVPGAPGMYPFQPQYPMAAPMVQPMAVQGGVPVVPQQQQQQQVRQPVQMSEDDLNQCKDMFPNIEMDVIKSVAEAERGNKDATINALLTMND